MRRAEYEVGGGEGIKGLYGSIAKAGMDKIIKVLIQKTGLSPNSVLIDFGSGLARPLAHAATHPGVRRSVGIEIDAIKDFKARQFLQRVSKGMQDAGYGDVANRIANIRLILGNINTALNTTRDNNSASAPTHAYTFWEGITAGKHAVARVFNRLRSLRYIVVVQHGIRGNPELYMQDHGFVPLKLLDRIPVAAQGGRESFQAYVFKKIT
jgi:hypothetical protein